MNAEEKLKEIRERLERCEDSRQINLALYESQLEKRLQQGERAETLEGFVSWIETYKEQSAQQIEGLKAEAGRLEAQISTPEYQAEKRVQAALANMKEIARTAWLENGGRADDFEAKWPEMEHDILRKRNIENLNKL